MYVLLTFLGTDDDFSWCCCELCDIISDGFIFGGQPKNLYNWD